MDKKIKGQPIELKEADDKDEAAPKAKDLKKARELVRRLPLLRQMFEADEIRQKDEAIS